MYIYNTSVIGLGFSQKSFGLGLQDGAAAALDLVFPDGQPAEEIPDPLLYEGLGSQAQVSGGFLSRPAPDGLIGASVRAVARQSLPS